MCGDGEKFFKIVPMNKLNIKRIKNNIRSHSGRLLIIAVLLSLVAFMNGIELYDKVQYAMQEVNEYKYPYEYSLNISGFGDLNELKNYVTDKLDGNTTIENLLVYMDDLKMYAKSEIVLEFKEEWPFPYEIICEKGEVLIGNGKRDLCYKNGDDLCIRFNGKEHIVRGYITGGISDILDGKMIIFYRESIPDEILQGGDSCELLFGTKNINAADQINSLILDDRYNISANNKPIAYVSTGDANARISFNMILCFFSVVNCIIISEFWIMRREREIVIRRLCGFSEISIFRLIYIDMLINSSISFGLFIVLRLIQGFVSEWNFGLLFRYIPACAGFVLTISLVLVIIPVRMARSFRMSCGMEG